MVDILPETPKHSNPRDWNSAQQSEHDLDRLCYRRKFFLLGQMTAAGSKPAMEILHRPHLCPQLPLLPACSQMLYGGRRLILKLILVFQNLILCYFSFSSHYFDRKRKNFTIRIYQIYKESQLNYTTYAYLLLSLWIDLTVPERVKS